MLPFGVASMSHDSPDRIRDDVVLRGSDASYRLLFEHMTAAFALHELILDEQGQPIDYRILEVNPAFERVIGLSAATVLGKTVKQVWPETEQYWVDVYGSVALSGEPITYQNYANALGKYLEVCAFCPRKGQCAVVFTDITERIHAEKERRTLAEAVEQSPTSVVITDPTGAITYVNPKFCAVTGYAPDEVLGQNPRILQSGVTPQEIYAALWSTLTGGGVWHDLIHLDWAEAVPR